MNRVKKDMDGQLGNIVGMASGDNFGVYKLQVIVFPDFLSKVDAMRIILLS